jgi:hypothetical protein
MRALRRIRNWLPGHGVGTLDGDESPVPSLDLHRVDVRGTHVTDDVGQFWTARRSRPAGAIADHDSLPDRPGIGPR